MAETTGSRNGSRLTLLSWNLHGLPWPLTKDLTGRISRATAKIRELAPEVVLLQEAWRVAETGQIIRALQPEWTPYFAQRRNNRARGGLLVLANANAGWELRRPTEFHPFSASAPAWRFWEGDGLSGKGALVLDFARGDNRFIIVNTHMQSPYPGIDYADIRRSQLTQLHTIMSGLDRTVPRVLAGDLNTDAREPLYSAIAALGTDLTVETREKSDCGTIFDWRDGRQEWIDYVLASGPDHVRALGDTTLIRNDGRDNPFSDHNGLFATIKFVSPEAKISATVR